MLRRIRKSFQPMMVGVLMAAALMLSGAKAFAVTFPMGDCDHDDSTGISELQTCINLFLGEPGTCKECSQSCSVDDVGIADLQKDINCFLDTTDPNCPAVDCGGGEPTPVPTPPTARCGDGSVQAPEQCDDGSACFAGTALGQLCMTDANCPGGGAGSCRPFGGDGCANNCTTEKNLVYTFSGAVCKGGTKDGQGCSFKSTCTGGPTPNRPCTLNTECGDGGTCQSECTGGGVCVGDGECTTALGGVTQGAQCYMLDASNEAKFCSAGTNAGKLCSNDAGCPSAPAGSCKGACGSVGATNGICENKSRSALVSLAVPIDIGPMIGSSIIRYGSPGANGLVPVTTHQGDTQFAPVKVPGLVCACVRGGLDPAAHGPNNTGSGIVNCGATPLANDVTLAVDHNTATPGKCAAGPNIGNSCTNKCAAGGARAGKPCLVTGDCPGDTNPQKQCNATVDCASAQGCTLGNGPGHCVGGASDGRACFDNTQCGTGKCTGKCVTGNVGTDCSCDGTARICDGGACGAAGTCRVPGNGGGFCMGPAKFCTGGTSPGKACFNATECPGGGACNGTGNFLKFCTSNGDCPGSLCNSIDDPTCSLQDPQPPAGSGAKACLEANEVCTGGTLIGQPCTSDAFCGAGGQCGTLCSARSDHIGACNSPTHITLTGAAQQGAGLFLNTISIGTISDLGTCGLAALCIGGSNDLKQCFVAGDCPGGGTCATAICAGTCAGGGSMGRNCLANNDCPGSTCTPGNNYKAACTNEAACGGSHCAAVSGFAAAGPPLSLGVGKGIDGLPCTDDDDPGVKGVQQTIPQTTGRSLALIGDTQNIAGQQLVHQNCIQSAQGDKCKSTLVGKPLSCDILLGQNPTASGLRLASAFPTLDGQTGDAAVTTFLTAR